MRDRIAKRLPGIAALAFAAAAISGPARAESQALPVPAERTYALRGDLTAALALDLQAALRAGFRRLSVTSRGGEVLVARAMADLLNRHDALLVAEGQCHSACAYLWLATRRHALGPQADLALHATFDAAGTNDFGALWLAELGRKDLVRWARSSELHHLTPQDLDPEAKTP